MAKQISDDEARMLNALVDAHTNDISDVDARQGAQQKLLEYLSKVIEACSDTYAIKHYLDETLEVMAVSFIFGFQSGYYARPEEIMT